jgi:hypothetical protein
VGRHDLVSAVDAGVLDEQAQERLRLLGVARTDDVFELVGDGGEVGGVGRCGRFWGEPGEGEFLCSRRSVRRVSSAAMRVWNRFASESPVSKAV